MAIPAGVTRCSITGTFGAGDIFDASIWYTGMTIASNAAAATVAGTLATALMGAGVTALKTAYGPADAITGTKVYHYPTGGPHATFIGAAGVTGMVGTGTQDGPLQNSLCVTGLTASSGRSFKGRTYFPGNGFVLGVGSGSNINAAQLTTWLSAWATAINAFSAANSGSTPVVVSSHLGVATPITQFRVTTKMDTQRRRANKQMPLTTVVTAV